MAGSNLQAEALQLLTHLGEPVNCEDLLDTAWEHIQKTSTKGTLMKAIREFQEQAVAGLVTLGSNTQVSPTAQCFDLTLAWIPQTRVRQT